MNYIINLPNGSRHSTSSAEEVVSTLKTNGVRNLNKRKPPSNLKTPGTAEFEGSLGRKISVIVRN